MLYCNCSNFTFMERKSFMKKFVSLLLTVLMIASLTVTAGAATIISSSGLTSSTPAISSYDQPVKLSDLFNYYKSFYTSNGNYYVPDFIYTGGIPTSDIYSAWYGTCPECKGFAFYHVSDGDIKWACLESKCGKTGTISAPSVPDDDDECKVTCPKCGRSSSVILIDTYYNSSTGKVENHYFCSYCENIFTKTTSIIGDYDTPDDITCSDISCRKDAEFQYYFYQNGYLYARYMCSSGHYTDKRVYGYDYDFYLYNVKVVTTTGGSYTIKGGEKAAYGETKTITFTPNYGYVLTDVYVNGVAVDVSEEIKVEVKGNTVVRAYFSKVSDLKNFKVTATAIGGGKITATLNSKSVDPSSIVAKYNDTITYRFTPSSSNYTIASVKVNGKSVGTASAYTVSRLTSDTKIEVTFKWNCPYDDVTSSSKYYNAIEYVTEAGILTGSYTNNTLKPKYNFNGTRAVTIKTFACALAEMSDVKGVLSNNTDRVDWAVANGLIGKKEDTSVVCDVQRACDMVKVYLEVLEDKNDVSFVGVSAKDSAKETAVAIGMVTSTTYKKNRNLNKNDLAAVLYLISNLEYKG